MATILIAEDDENLQLLISRRLMAQYAVVCARDGKEALDMLRDRHIDLLIADIMMPRLDGFELVQNLRHQGLSTPVLMLTANQSFDAKRIGFSSGTDDYMTKPVNCEELLWRIQALLRRARIFSSNKIEIGGAVLDSTTYTIAKGDRSLELPRKEFDLLFKLLSYPGRIFTKNQLLDSIWGSSSESSEDTVKTHISRLRNKLKDFDEFSIVAVKGIGYKAEVAGERANEG
jgi:two-component system, OmpR family, response regulator